MERFGNLLFALFTSRCPLFLEVKSIIKALYLYSDNALKAMCSKTRGSIMWILTLQTRHFLFNNSFFREYQSDDVVKIYGFDNLSSPLRLGLINCLIVSVYSTNNGIQREVRRL